MTLPAVWRARAPWIILVVALVLRLGFAASQGLGRPILPGSDDAEYDAYAWNVAQGNGYRGMSPDVADQNHLTAYRSPGPSLLFAAVYRVIGHRLAPIRVLNCLLSALCCLLIVAIGRRCFDENTGLIAATIWAMWPVSIFLSGGIVSDHLATLVLLALVVVALKFADKPTLTAALVTGLVLGINLLVHPSRLFLLPMFGLWVLIQFWGSWKSFAFAATIPLVALLVLAPWIVRNQRVFHRFIPFSTMGGSVLLQGNNRIVATDPEYLGYNVWDTAIPEYKDALIAPNDEFGRDSVAKKLAKEWIGTHRDRWIPMAIAKIRRGWTPFLQPHTPLSQRLGMLVAWGPILLLLIIGFVPSLLRFLRAREPGWLLHAVILHMVALDVVFFGLARYRYVVEPYCVLIAVATVVRWWGGRSTTAASPAAV
jgi:4-amino-4-deoxy-L-arabinose transferase-like glycosyltransferase